MKKVITLMLVAAATTLGFSQQVKFGVKGGVNVTDLNGAENGLMNGVNTLNVGFNVGAFVEYKVQDKMYIQPELQLSTQGASSDHYGYDGYSNTEKRVNLTYLNLPVMVKYEVVNKLKLEVGPQFGYALAGNVKYQETGASYNVSLKQNLFKKETQVVPTTIQGNTTGNTTITTPQYAQRFDFGLNFGFSYDLSSDVFLQARYNLGLTNISKIQGEKVYNRGVQVGLGYKF